MKANVGKSKGRTPGKHELLNAVLGKQIGAFTRLRQRYQWSIPFVIIDLCAGDGFDTEESGTCSPRIITKHSQWLRGRIKDDNASAVILIEKDSNTFDLLRNRYDDFGCVILKGDSNSDSVVTDVKSVLEGLGLTPKCPVFIHHDPNSVANWCLREEYLELSDLVTTMVTMGCNVGGVKRMELSERQEWFDNFKLLRSHVKRTMGRLDLCLIALNNDASKWAYALSVPSKWRSDTVDAVYTAFRYWGKGIELEWMNGNHSQFDCLQYKLFLTKKEFEQKELMEGISHDS